MAELRLIVWALWTRLTVMASCICKMLCIAGFQQDSIKGVHHVGMICEDLQKSLHFYKDVLGAKSHH
jgi:hypothetical protein